MSRELGVGHVAQSRAAVRTGEHVTGQTRCQMGMLFAFLLGKEDCVRCKVKERGVISKQGLRHAPSPLGHRMHASPALLGVGLGARLRSWRSDRYQIVCGGLTSWGLEPRI